MKNISFLIDDPSPSNIEYVELLKSQNAKILGIDQTIRFVGLR